MRASLERRRKGTRILGEKLLRIEYYGVPEMVPHHIGHALGSIWETGKWYNTVSYPRPWPDEYGFGSPFSEARLERKWEEITNMRNDVGQEEFDAMLVPIHLARLYPSYKVLFYGGTQCSAQLYLPTLEKELSQ